MILFLFVLIIILVLININNILDIIKESLIIENEIFIVSISEFFIILIVVGNIIMIDVNLIGVIINELNLNVSLNVIDVVIYMIIIV